MISEHHGKGRCGCCCLPYQECPNNPIPTGPCEPTFQMCKMCTCGPEPRPMPCKCGDDPDEYFCEECAAQDTCIDLAFDDFGDLASDEAVMSAMLVQLAIKGKADEEDEEGCETPCSGDCGDKGGWWYESFVEHKYGNRLWTLENQPSTNQTRLQANQFLQEDVIGENVDCGIIKGGEVNSQIDDCGVLCVNYLDVEMPDKSDRRLELACLWQNQTTV